MVDQRKSSAKRLFGIFGSGLVYVFGQSVGETLLSFFGDLG